jgi:hypothetical protein
MSTGPRPTIPCPYCAQSMILAPELGGQLVACPFCGGQFNFPSVPHPIRTAVAVPTTVNPPSTVGATFSIRTSAKPIVKGRSAWEIGFVLTLVLMVSACAGFVVIAFQEKDHIRNLLPYAFLLLALFAVGGLINSLMQRKKAATRLRQLNQALRASNLDPALVDSIVSEMRRVARPTLLHPIGRMPGSTAPIYVTALDLLAGNPRSTVAKQLALELGRWHFGIARPDGLVTIYDEQAIQNDILVRSQG